MNKNFRDITGFGGLVSGVIARNSDPAHEERTPAGNRSAIFGKEGTFPFVKPHIVSPKDGHEVAGLDHGWLGNKGIPANMELSEQLLRDPCPMSALGYVASLMGELEEKTPKVQDSQASLSLSRDFSNLNDFRMGNWKGRDGF